MEARRVSEPELLQFDIAHVYAKQGTSSPPKARQIAAECSL